MPRKMRTFILLLALWFVGDRALAFAMDRLLDHSRDPIARLYGGGAAADVVVLGNSRAYRNIDLGALSRGFNGRVSAWRCPAPPWKSPTPCSTTIWTAMARRPSLSSSCRRCSATKGH
jgi:hypothetical protein